jgi:hypothetical protein
MWSEVNMKNVLYCFMVFAACGLALSITVHGMELADIVTPGKFLIKALNFGIIVVWVPTVIIASHMTRHVSRNDFWRVALEGCPVWMRRGLRVIVGYSVLNFVFYIVKLEGKKTLSSDQTTSVDLSGFSGHWMIFYAAAFAILYSRIHAPKSPEDLSASH